MENELRFAMNDGVTGIISTLTSDDDVCFRHQDVDNLSLTFIAPLRADQDCVRHN